MFTKSVVLQTELFVPAVLQAGPLSAAAVLQAGWLRSAVAFQADLLRSVAVLQAGMLSIGTTSSAHMSKYVVLPVVILQIVTGGTVSTSIAVLLITSAVSVNEVPFTKSLCGIAVVGT